MKQSYLYFKPRLQLILLASLCAFTFSIECFSKEKKAHFQGTVSLQNRNEKDYTNLARVSVKEAIAETSKNVKGDVTTVRLDQRNGFLVYVVEVDDNKPGSYLQEVLIDAGSGTLLSSKSIK